MKVIDLEHKDHKLAKEEHKKHGKLCGLGSVDGVYKIICRCDEKPAVKEVKVEIVDKKKARKDIIKDIDADGNGHITKKEVKDYFDKK